MIERGVSRHLVTEGERRHLQASLGVGNFLQNPRVNQQSSRAVLTGLIVEGNPRSEIFGPCLCQLLLFFRERLERRMAWRMLIHLVLVCWCASSVVNGIRFDVSSSANKCVSEEIQTNVVVLANYSVVKDETAKDAHTISLKVTSPYGDVLHHTDNVLSGQFGFTSRESGSYVACFWIANAPQGATSSVDLDWKVGLAAKDWATIARKDKIEGVELELRKLEGAVEAIHDNLLYLKSREAEMREVSETTNSRVAWFSILSLMVCLLVSAWQLWYLKRYFEKKKLI